MTMREAQFKSIMKSDKFAADKYETDGTGHTPPAILSQDLKNNINAAGFESTAITAAVGFEQKAVKLYGERADTTTDSEEKTLPMVVSLGTDPSEKAAGPSVRSETADLGRQQFLAILTIKEYHVVERILCS